MSACLSFPSSLIFASAILVLAVGWDLKANFLFDNASVCLERQEVRSRLSEPHDCTERQHITE